MIATLDRKDGDLDLLFRRTYEDYLRELRFYRKIEDNKCENMLQKRSKQVFLRSGFIGIVDKELPKLIYSFAAYEVHGHKLVLHFVFTKEEFRNHGFAQHILNHLKTYNNVSRFVYTVKTSKPKSHSLFRNYRMELHEI